MRSMQAKITDELAAVAAGLGLEIVHAGGCASNAGTLYYQDGLYSPLVITYDFQSRYFGLTLTGLAVNTTTPEYRRTQRPGVFRTDSQQRLSADFHLDNDNGEEITAAIDLVKRLLAPYQPKPAAGKAANR